VFVNSFIGPRYGVGSLVPNINMLGPFYNGVLTMGKTVVFTAFGDPFVKSYLPMAPVYVCVYDPSIPAQNAVVDVWLGKAPATGRLPVSLPHIFREGDGLDLRWR
jgi:beta-N-acetylhexosaminidase